MYKNIRSLKTDEYNYMEFSKSPSILEVRVTNIKRET